MAVFQGKRFPSDPCTAVHTERDWTCVRSAGAAGVSEFGRSRRRGGAGRGGLCYICR